VRLSGAAADDRGTPIESSFCQHTVAAGRPLIVDDAREHPLLRDNAAIAGRSLIAYAGIPLVDDEDNVLGVLCAIDTKPRRWSDEDVVTLRRLAERGRRARAPRGVAQVASRSIHFAPRGGCHASKRSSRASSESSRTSIARVSGRRKRCSTAWSSIVSSGA